MQPDFLRELEYLGVTARLKRLSDTLSASIKDYYKANGVDIEPSWHLVLLYLDGRSAPLTELASGLRLSQPAATKMVQRMIERGYLEEERDEADGRKKLVRLSTHAKRRMPRLRRVWAAGQATVREILGADRSFLDELAQFEDRIAEKGFAERAGARLARD